MALTSTHFFAAAGGRLLPEFFDEFAQDGPAFVDQVLALPPLVGETDEVAESFVYWRVYELLADAVHFKPASSAIFDASYSRPAEQTAHWRDLAERFQRKYNRLRGAAVRTPLLSDRSPRWGRN